VPPVPGKTRFHDLDLPPEIMHAIHDLGFQYCTPIQAATLPQALAGEDIAGKAQTGTGKTAAFLITILTQFKRRPPAGKRGPGTPRALIMTPTRELALQVTNDASLLAKYSRCNVVAVFGGMDYQKQRHMLTEQAVDIVVATPGRLLDFKRQGDIHLGRVEILVIDEADEMLNMGFIPDIRQIVNSTPPREKRQTMLFGATLTPQVNRLASQWTRNPVTVDIDPEQVAVDTVDQVLYLIRARERFTVLYNLITQQNLTRVLVFCNRRDQTRRLAERLTAHGISCAVLSGDVAQRKRITTLEAFRSGKIKVLVATDVAGRGIHIEAISHVVNYNLPLDAEDYVHRIGRTGRAGATGKSIGFATEEESFQIPAIEKYLGGSVRCAYPDDVLLAPLPRPSAGESSQPRQEASQPRRYRGRR
jgi:ATP-dependent RNA helicase RhlB